MDSQFQELPRLQETHQAELKNLNNNIAGLVTTVTRLGARYESLQQTTHARFDLMSKGTNARFDTMSQEMNAIHKTLQAMQIQLGLKTVSPSSPM